MPNVMAALRIYVAPSVENDEKQKFHNPILVPSCKVWLTPTARVPCCSAANIGERKSWTQSELCTWQNSVKGQEPPKMYMYNIPAQEMTKHHAKFG